MVAEDIFALRDLRLGRQRAVAGPRPYSKDDQGNRQKDDGDPQSIRE